MAYLGNDLQVAFPVYRNIDDISGSFNSSATSFPLTVNGVAPVPAPLYSQQCLISVGGVVQRPDDSGSEGFRLSGSNIVFASAPTTGADFFGVILAGADYVDAGGNFPSGTASVPSITFNDDLDTGIFNSGANQISFATGGSERLRIDSAGQIESVSLGTAAAPAFSFTTDPNTGFYSPGADQLAISTNGTGRVFIDSSGRLLVGTSTAPNAGDGQYSRLVVQGNTVASSAYFSLSRNQAATSMASGNDLGLLCFTDNAGNSFGRIECYADATPGTNDYPGRLVFSTTADGASSPTERMRITNGGNIRIGSALAYASEFFTVNNGGTLASEITAFGGSGGVNHKFYFHNGAAGNAAGTVYWTNANSTTGRSINAGGTINASGADYAEYMVKAGDFTINKGDICGVTSDGLLTLIYQESAGFLVKSTNPSYVGNDGWGAGYEDDTDGLELVRKTVDRIAFAGQVPVNVMGAVPGQYIVPTEAADGGIEGVAKNEADLTLAEYMRAVGKVIAIEDDGRARIIVKVA